MSHGRNRRASAGIEEILASLGLGRDSRIPSGTDEIADLLNQLFGSDTGPGRGAKSGDNPCPVAYGMDRFSIDNVESLFWGIIERKSERFSMRLAASIALPIFAHLRNLVTEAYAGVDTENVLSFGEIHSAVSEMFPQYRCENWERKQAAKAEREAAAQMAEGMPEEMTVTEETEAVLTWETEGGRD